MDSLNLMNQSSQKNASIFTDAQNNIEQNKLNDALQHVNQNRITDAQQHVNQNQQSNAQRHIQQNQQNDAQHANQNKLANSQQQKEVSEQLRSQLKGDVIIPEKNAFTGLAERKRTENEKDLPKSVKSDKAEIRKKRAKISESCAAKAKEANDIYEKKSSEDYDNYQDEESKRQHGEEALSRLLNEPLGNIRLVTDEDVIAAIPRLHELRYLDSLAFDYTDKLKDAEMKQYTHISNVINYGFSRLNLIRDSAYASYTNHDLNNILEDFKKGAKNLTADERRLAGLMKDCEDSLNEIKKGSFILADSEQDIMLSEGVTDQQQAKSLAAKRQLEKSAAAMAEKATADKIEGYRVERRIGELKSFLKKKGYQVPTAEIMPKLLTRVEKAMAECRPEELTLDKIPFEIVLADANVAAQYVTKATEDLAIDKNPELQYVSQREQNEFTEIMPGLFEDLRKYKDKFGGKPHFPNGDPDFDNETLNKRIWGMQYNMLEAYWGKKIRNASNFFTRTFWTACARVIGIKNAGAGETTKYERIFKAARSMEKLAQYKTVITQEFEKDKVLQERDLENAKQANERYQQLQQMRYDKNLPAAEKAAVQDEYTRLFNNMKTEAYTKYAKGNLLLGKLTQMGAHEGSHGAGAEIDNMGQMLIKFKEKYLKAKEYNDLEAFFEALDGGCLDDRVRMISTEYEPVDRRKKERVEFPDPKDGSLWFKNSDQLPEIPSDNTILAAIDKFARALYVANDINTVTDSQGVKTFDETATIYWSEILPELKRHMIGKEFIAVNDGGVALDRKEITEEDLETAHQVLITIGMIEEERS